MLILGFDRADLSLIVNLWRMNLADRYLGSALGGAWAILNPLLMFALFTFVFGFVFKARLPGGDSTLDYSLWLICGYGPWLANSEALTASSNSIIGNAGLVKNMSFKTDVLPISAVLLGLVPLSVSMVFVVVLQLLNGYGLQLSILWMPLIVFVQFLFLAALGVLIAAITTFVRDFGIVLPNLLMIALFATPIFYTKETLPRIVQLATELNPIYIIGTAYRAVMLGGQAVPVFSLLALAFVSYFFLKVNLSLFRRVKFFFPSVL